jgi:histidine ammonia-lyase
VRSQVKKLDRDRAPSPDIRALEVLIASGAFSVS